MIFGFVACMYTGFPLMMAVVGEKRPSEAAASGCALAGCGVISPCLAPCSSSQRPKIGEQPFRPRVGQRIDGAAESRLEPIAVLVDERVPRLHVACGAHPRRSAEIDVRHLLGEEYNS